VTKAKKPVGKPKAKIEDAVVSKTTNATKTAAIKKPDVSEYVKETKLDRPAQEAPAKDVKKDVTKPTAKITPKTAQVKKNKSVFAPMLLGGLVSGALGFGAATYYFINQPSAEAQILKEAQATLSEQQAQLEAANSRISGLSEAIKVMKTDTSIAEALAGLTKSTEISEQKDVELAQTASGLADTVSGIDTRLAALEKLPVTEAGGMTSKAAAAYERELQAMRALLQTQRSDIEKLAADATARIQAAAEKAQTLEQSAGATAKMTAQRVAISRLQSALDNGAAFEGPLSNLAATGDIEIPQVLKDAAKIGVPSLASLQEGFPIAARAALTASLKATTGDGALGKLGSFLQSQVGGRSLEPRDGDDADAVLSRAEAAIGRGDIQGAVALVGALPEAAQAAMSDWLVAATTRHAAMDAIKTLAAGLNGN